MSSRILVFVLAMVSTLTIHAAAPAIESVPLHDSTALKLEGQSHQTFDALQFKSDVSIALQSCADITISDCDLHSIELSGCEHVTVRNCWIHDSAHCGVQLYKCRHVLVEGCRIEKVPSGVYAMESSDVQVIGNFARNMQGPFPRGQLAQLNNVTGRENTIRGNYAINDKGRSHPEDVINIYMSRGEADAPIIVEDNYLVGDPRQGSSGKSKTGSGIMLADQGGAYQVCRHNIVLSAGQVGIGVAGGTFIRVEDNSILGARSEVSNTGLYAWNQSKAPSHDVFIAHNRVHWLDLHGEATDWWDGGGVSKLKQVDNHFADETLDSNIPAPPSQAPLPPRPHVSTDSAGHAVVCLPWKP